MQQISEQHQKQLTTLREEIRGKETQMETLKEYLFICLFVSIDKLTLIFLVHCKNYSYHMINFRVIMIN